MKRGLALILLVVACAAGAAAQQKPPQEPGEYGPPDIRDQKRPLNLLVTVSGPFDQAPFFAMLDALTDVKWTKAVMPADAGMLKRGLESKYDAVLFADTYQRTPAEQKDLGELLSRRMGFVILSVSNPTWTADMVGGKVGSAAGAAGRVTLKPADAQHPATRGVKDFSMSDTLAPSVARTPNTLPVLRADSPSAGDDGVVAWSLMYGDPYGLSRVLVMRIGQQPGAWSDSSFRRVLSQSLKWTACAAWGRFCAV